MPKAAVLTLAFAVAPALLAADPPRPDIGKPVDYVKWANEAFGTNAKDNAAAAYERIVATLPADDPVYEFLTKPPSALTALQRDQINAFLSKHEQNLREFAGAARMRACYFAFAGQRLDKDLPSPTDYRRPAKATAARARQRLAAGEVEAAKEDIATLLLCSAHFQRQARLIHHLTGIAIWSTACEATLDFVNAGRSAAELNGMLTLLAANDLAPARLTNALLVEQAALYDILQHDLRDTNGDGKYERLSANQPEVGELQIDPPQTLAEIADEVAAQMTRLRAIFVDEYPEARERRAAFEQELARDPNAPCSYYFGSLGNVAGLQRRHLAQYRALRCVLAVYAYHATHGRWPATLAEALPKNLARCAMDPYSSAPFVYKPPDGNDANATPLLYSLSENGTDDGGAADRAAGKSKWGPEGDFVFWPRP